MITKASANSRRNFIKKVAAGTAATALGLSRTSYGRIVGANERIGVGFIGMGRQMRGLLNGVLNQEDTAQVIALCDVYQPNLDYTSSRQAPDAATYSDYREILERDDIDAVVVGTPDHWHALQTIHACEAGIDVYVEKPTAVYIEESRKMLEAAREHDRIVQVGTQQRSDPHFQQAVEIVRNGRIGPINFVRTWNYRLEYPEGIGNPPDSDPPAGLDWDMWLGPAPERPFNINRFGVIVDDEGNYQQWASFRWFWDYAGGMMTDWGVHLLDIVQWAMEVDYPESVSAHGGKFILNDNRETPDVIAATYQYPDFVCTYENRETNRLPIDGKEYGISFHGTYGTLIVDRGGFEIIPEPGSDLEPETHERVNPEVNHLADFFNSMRSREKPICDIEIGHRSSTTAILGNIAYRSGRTIKWNGETETVLDDMAAHNMTRARYRRPWSI